MRTLPLLLSVPSCFQSNKTNKQTSQCKPTSACLVLLSIILFAACSQKPHLEATISGLGNDSVFVNYAFVSQAYDSIIYVRDTLIASNDRFSYDKQFDEVAVLIFYPEEKGRPKSSRFNQRNFQKFITVIFLPEENLSIRGELAETCTKYVANGSEMNEQFSRIRQKYIEKTAAIQGINATIDSLYAINGDSSLMHELYQRRGDLYDIKQAIEIDFVKNNPGSELSAFYLTHCLADTTAKYYQSLEENVKEGLFKSWLDEQMKSYQWIQDIKEAKSKTQSGATAPDFKLESLDGSYISLKDIKTEFVVLDFWGSWCGPCVAGFPKMKEYYRKYNNRIEFIGISCYDTEVDWKKSVKENGAEWLQLINRENNKNDILLKYGVRSFPTKLILDKDRRIISRSTGEANEFYEVLDDLMSP